MLGLLQRQPRGIADAQYHVPLAGALLPGEELVAIALRDIGLDEDVLLAQVLLPDQFLYVSTKGPVLPQKAFFVLLQVFSGFEGVGVL